MAKIPRQVARREIPSGRVVGAIIPTSLADVGQGIEAQGLADIGRGVGDLGQALGKIAFAEGSSQADEAIGLANSRIKLLGTELSTISDTDQYDAKFEEALAEIADLRPDHPVGGKQFDDYLDVNVGQWQVGVDVLKINQTKANIEGRYITALNKARTEGNSPLAQYHTIRARDVTGVITPEQAARDLVQTKTFIGKIREIQLQEQEGKNINAALAQARDIFDETGDELQALDSIRDSDLVPEDKKQGVQSDLSTEIGYRVTLKNEKTKQQEEVSAREMLSRPNLPTVGELQERVKSTGDDRISIATFNSLKIQLDKQTTRQKDIRGQLKKLEGDTAKTQIVLRKQPTADAPAGTLTVDDLQGYAEAGLITGNEFDAEMKELAGRKIAAALLEPSTLKTRSDLRRQITSVKERGGDRKQVVENIIAAKDILKAGEADDMIASLDKDEPQSRIALIKGMEDLGRAVIAPSSGSIRPVGPELQHFNEFILEWAKIAPALPDDKLEDAARTLIDKWSKSTIVKIRLRSAAIKAERLADQEVVNAQLDAMIGEPLEIQTILLNDLIKRGLIKSTKSAGMDSEREYIEQLTGERIE